MKKFTYQTLTTAGVVESGMLEADDLKSGLRSLESRGLTVISIEDYNPEKRAFSWIDRLFRKKVTRSARILAIKQLALLLQSGVPLFDAVKSLAANSGHEDLSAAFHDIGVKLRAGTSLAMAFKEAFGGLPEYAYQLVSAGEASGKLAGALQQVADQLTYEEGLSQDIKNALIYPSVLIVAGITAVFFVFIVVVPKFSSMLKGDAQDNIPLLSQLVLNVGNFLNSHLWAILAVLVLVVLGIRRALATPAIMSDLRLRLYRLPLVGQWLLEVDIARWSSTLAAMLKGGVDLIKALDFARQGVSAPELSVRLGQCAKDVRSGKALSETLAQNEILAGIAVSMVTVGEKSGNLPDMLEALARLYDDRGRLRMKRFLILLEPAAILIVGGVIGMIVVAVMMAITSVNQISI